MTSICLTLRFPLPALLALLALLLLPSSSSLSIHLPRRAFLASPALSPFLLASPATASDPVKPGKPALELYNKALNLQATGNIPSSLPLLKRVVEMEPGWTYGWSSLGDAQVSLGQVRRERPRSRTHGKPFLIIVRLHPTCLRFQIPPALESYKTSLSLCYPSCKDEYLLRLNYGVTLLNSPSSTKADLEEGLTQIQSSARLRNRPDSVVITNRAIAYDYLQQYSLAVADYEIAVQLSNDVSPWWLRRSMCKLELGDSAGAKEAWRRVQSRFPESAEVNAVGYVIYSSLSEVDKARECLSKVPQVKREEYAKAGIRRDKLRWGPKMEEGWVQAIREVKGWGGEEEAKSRVIEAEEKVKEAEAMEAEVT